MSGVQQQQQDQPKTSMLLDSLTGWTSLSALQVASTAQLGVVLVSCMTLAARFALLRLLVASLHLASAFASQRCEL